LRLCWICGEFFVVRLFFENLREDNHTGGVKFISAFALIVPFVRAWTDPSELARTNSLSKQHSGSFGDLQVLKSCLEDRFLRRRREEDSDKDNK
jgi:hypothetical protein